MLRPAPFRCRCLLVVLAVQALIGACGPDHAPDSDAPTKPGWSLSTSVPQAANDPFDLQAALERIRRGGHTPEEHPWQGPGPVRAISGICTGSQNGRCQDIFVFDEARLVGSIHAAFISIIEQDGTKVTVRLPQYVKGDPFCCPSGGDTTHTVTLKAGAIHAEPPIPTDANNTGAI